jgi:hypothetical protein
LPTMWPEGLWATDVHRAPLRAILQSQRVVRPNGGNREMLIDLTVATTDVLRWPTTSGKRISMLTEKFSTRSFARPLGRR